MNDLVFKNSGIFPEVLDAPVESNKYMEYATGRSDKLDAQKTSNNILT